MVSCLADIVPGRTGLCYYAESVSGQWDQSTRVLFSESPPNLLVIWVHTTALVVTLLYFIFLAFEPLENWLSRFDA